MKVIVRAASERLVRSSLLGFSCPLRPAVEAIAAWAAVGTLSSYLGSIVVSSAFQNRARAPIANRCAVVGTVCWRKSA